MNAQGKRENWKPFLSGYGITDKGRVLSFKYRPHTVHFMKPQISGKGMPYVILHHQGIKKKLYIHLLVVQHFGDRNGRLLGAEGENLRKVGLSIKHIDNDPTNNDVANLEIVKFKRRTRKEMGADYGT